MRKIMIASLLVITVLLAGCQGWLRIALDVPIILEPDPPYRAEIDGYVSYDSWVQHVQLTNTYSHQRFYEPLVNAKITVLETGKVTYTDRNGYFFLRGVPYGKLTLVVEHRRLWEKSYFTVRSR